MSIEAVTRKGGETAYKVRYRDHAGKERADTLPSEAEAVERDTQIKLAKARNEPLPQLGRGRAGQTFEQFTEAVWWPQYVEANGREAKTREQYIGLLKNHLGPLIADDVLAYINVPRVLKLRADLAASGAPDYTRARALKLFRQIMAFAVQSGAIPPPNPAELLRERGALPSQKRAEDVRPLWPDETEEIRRAILATESPNKQRDATAISTMAYAGLRPMEIRALTWGNVDGAQIRVAKTKPGTRPHTVPKLIRPLLDDLASWRDACPRKSARAYVFPGVNGREWTDAAYATWRGRVWRKHAPADADPYDLRHGYAGLLAREHVQEREAARRMGHGIATHQLHYDALYERYDDDEPTSMEALVLKARES